MSRSLRFYGVVQNLILQYWKHARVRLPEVKSEIDRYQQIRAEIEPKLRSNPDLLCHLIDQIDRAIQRLTTEMQTSEVFISYVDRAIALLPDVCQEIVNLFYGKGLSTVGVSQETNYSTGRVESLRQQACMSVYISVMLLDEVCPSGYFWIERERAGLNSQVHFKKYGGCDQDVG